MPILAFQYSAFPPVLFSLPLLQTSHFQACLYPTRLDVYPRAQKDCCWIHHRQHGPQNAVARLNDPYSEVEWIYLAPSIQLHVETSDYYLQIGYLAGSVDSRNARGLVYLAF